MPKLPSQLPALTTLSRRAAGARPRPYAAALFLSALALLSCRDTAVPLQLVVSGCELLWKQSAAVLLCVPESQLLLDVQCSPGAPVMVQVDQQAAQKYAVSSSGQSLISVPISATAQQLVVTHSGRVAQRILLRRELPFPRALALLKQLPATNDLRQRASDLVSRSAWLERSAADLDQAERAFFWFEIAQRQELSNLAAAPTYDRASQLARVAGVFSIATQAAVRHASNRAEHEGPQAAAQLLIDPSLEESFRNDPRANYNRHYALANYALEMGQLRAAREYQAELQRLMQRYGFDTIAEVDATSRYLRANLMQRSGETVLAEQCIAETVRELPGIMKKSTYDHQRITCEVQRYYLRFARLRMLGEEAGLGYRSPLDLLQKAEALGVPCTDSNEDLPSLLAMRARSLLSQAERAGSADPEQAARLAEVATLLVRSQQLFSGTASGELTIDWLFIAGRMALLQGQPEAARHAFVEMEAATLKLLDPYTRWSALVGQADAAVQRGEHDAATAAYQRAEELLDLMLSDVAIAARRQLFVAQFEAGTSRYVELLLSRPAQPQLALRVVRHAHTRALAAHFLQAGANQQDPVLSQRLQQYHALFAARERTEQLVADAPTSELGTARAELQAVEGRLATLLEKIYLGDQVAAPPPPLTAPAETEFLLTCHPQSALAGSAAAPWLCLGADAHDVYVARTLKPPQTLADAEAILVQFATPLGRAQRLRILPYGPMRTLDWDAARLAGVPLGKQLEVGYALDRPLLPRPAPGAQALAVVDPEEDLSAAHRLVARIAAALTGKGWAVTMRSGAQRRGGLIGSGLVQLWRGLLHPATPATAQSVREALGQASLFLYYGHAESAGPGGWDSHLRLAEQGRLTVRDIMTLPAVPQVVLLIGCETAVSDSAAPADELGLAQAFLLRGSRLVLATTRKVADTTAAQLVTELLSRDGLTPYSAVESDWPQALHGALRTLRQQQPAADWSAFRLYTQ